MAGPRVRAGLTLVLLGAVERPCQTQALDQTLNSAQLVTLSEPSTFSGPSTFYYPL